MRYGLCLMILLLVRHCKSLPEEAVKSLLLEMLKMQYERAMDHLLELVSFELEVGQNGFQKPLKT